MRRLVVRVRGFGAIAVVIVLGGLVLVGSAFAVAGSTKPDLVPELPAKRPAGLGKSVAPIYVDAYTMPGTLLYRFDTVIRNQGGTMDLYMQNGNAYQVIWKNGHPPGPVSPNHAPSPGPNIISIENRSAQAGAFFVYSPATGHRHWHFQQAARYELLLPGGGSRVSDKIGFCMFDTYPSTTSGKPRFFADGYTGGGQHSWCNRLDPGATFTRMGISPTYGDLYASQASWQWIDISGLKPQSYDVRATVNPLGYVDEGSATGNNVKTVHRTIPGTIANNATKSVAHNKALAVRDRRLDREPVGPGAEEREPLRCAHGHELLRGRQGHRATDLRRHPAARARHAVAGQQVGADPDRPVHAEQRVLGHRHVQVHRDGRPQAEEPAGHGDLARRLICSGLT